MITWIQVERVQGRSHRELPLEIIDELALLGAYYNGSGWFRVTREDVPVRRAITSHGLEYEVGKPPAELLRLPRRTARAVAHSIKNAYSVSGGGP